MTETDPAWSWPEDRWQSVVQGVRAGRAVRPKKWKGGARAIVALSFNCLNEATELGTGGTSAVRLSQGQYGDRKGLPRILRLLKAHGAVATFFVPAVTAMLMADDIKALTSAGHEIGLTSWIGEHSADLPAETARDLLAGARDTLERLSGTRPTGFRASGGELTPAVLTALRDIGITWDSSLMADDEPYELLVEGQPSGLIEIPVERIRDDASYFNTTDRPAAPEAVFDTFRRELEVAYEEGGIFQLTLHPHLTGHRSRLWIVEEILKIARTLPGIRFATHGEIAGWCRP